MGENYFLLAFVGRKTNRKLQNVVSLVKIQKTYQVYQILLIILQCILLCKYIFVTSSHTSRKLSFIKSFGAFFFISTNYRLERRSYVKLKDWMSNSVDPDETDLCCLKKPIIIACDSETVNRLCIVGKQRTSGPD